MVLIIMISDPEPSSVATRPERGKASRVVDICSPMLINASSNDADWLGGFNVFLRI